MRRSLELDDRLSRAAALFPACEYGADIGADHGRLSCFLLESGKAERMCVADISGDSLKKAEALLSLRGLAERADFKVGDGL
ncbi:MAG: tRNA (adenine(22)-N(1))-methyltransferase TrmK, partial [Clostridia bacterium]|nr:tRNA (adenine(22)-N(1))-methyltransferase TrmK [Clostridia bacterium]